MYYNISKASVQKAKSQLKLSKEICGIIRPISKKDPWKLGLDITDEGDDIKPNERGSCVTTNVWMNYHTHPYVVLPWPSTEDIFKILYKRDPDPKLWGCLIFTEWGIWEIYSPKKIDVNVIYSEIDDWTDFTSDELFYALNLDDEIKVADISEPNTKRAVNAYIQKWKSKYKDLGLEIKLTDWKTIPNSYTFKTGLKKVQNYY